MSDICARYLHGRRQPLTALIWSSISNQVDNICALTVDRESARKRRAVGMAPYFYLRFCYLLRFLKPSIANGPEPPKTSATRHAIYNRSTS
jgi:hypothetical protein